MTATRHTQPYTPAPVDWEAMAQEEAQPRQLPVRQTFVAPPAPVTRVEVLPPEATNWNVNLSPTNRPPVELLTTYTDRAKGFQLVTVPLAVGVGLLAVVLALVGLDRPFGLGLLLWFGLGFMLTWLVGFALHTIVGPDGALFWSVFGSYRLLREEQKERHRRMRRMDGGQ